MTGRTPITLYELSYNNPVDGWTPITDSTLGLSLTYTHVVDYVFTSGSSLQYRLLAQNGVGWGTVYSATLTVTADSYPTSMYVPTATLIAPLNITF